MVWFYKRDDVCLGLETRYDEKASEYVAVVCHPDGHRDTERFDRFKAFGAWLQAFEKRLEAERWAADGSAHVRRLA
jgi:hypothetical protein